MVRGALVVWFLSGVLNAFGFCIFIFYVMLSPCEVYDLLDMWFDDCLVLLTVELYCFVTCVVGWDCLFASVLTCLVFV